MLPFFVALSMSVLGVVGDYFLKIAGISKNTDLRWFILGVLIYALTAFGWFYAIRHLKLEYVGVIYSLSTVLLLTALGTFYFGESLSAREILGIGLAVASILLLARFA